MEKFELRKNNVEISYKNRSEIMEGCTLNQDNQDPIIIKSFDNKDDALFELQNYTTDVRKLSGGAGSYYSITEYYIEENTYNENGEWIEGGDVLEFSEIGELK